MGKSVNYYIFLDSIFNIIQNLPFVCFTITNFLPCIFYEHTYICSILSNKYYKSYNLIKTKFFVKI